MARFFLILLGLTAVYFLLGPWGVVLAIVLMIIQCLND
jgi:predicted PurR-regulated permease PerM